jgi:hypothetical protein
MGRRVALAIALVGCGRLGFDASSVARDGSLAADALDAPPPSLCAQGGFVMCDGFETDATGFADPPWSSAFNVTVDGAHVDRGALATHAHTPALAANPNYGSQLIDNTNRVTFAAGTTYVRAFVYLPSASSGTFLLAQVDDLSNTQLGKLFLGSGVLELQTSTGTMTGAGAFPTDRWECIEIAATGSTGASTGDGEVAVWLDDMPQFDAKNIDLYPLQQFAIGLGMYGGPARPASDLWIDEVALDSARIGCTR